MEKSYFFRVLQRQVKKGKINNCEFNLQQCLFGEHLLKKDPLKPVAIVESEKTAIIASAYLPKFIWLACGSLTNLNQQKCSVLKRRNVTLYPDLNCFGKWQDKCQELSNISNIHVSELLEKRATVVERKQGLDIADYLVRHNVQKFLVPNGTRPKEYFTHDITNIASENRTGTDFGNIVIVGLKTQTGEYLDLLFKMNGELFAVSEMQDKVKQLALFFEKELIPVKFEGVQGWQVLQKT